MVEKIWSTTYILKARNNKTEFVYCIRQKIGKYAEVLFYDMNLDFKTVHNYTRGTAVNLEEGLNKHCKFCFAICFETLEVERVEFRADNNNKRSIAAKVWLQSRRYLAQ
jgi:hypothetical protein